MAHYPLITEPLTGAVAQSEDTAKAGDQLELFTAEELRDL